MLHAGLDLSRKRLDVRVLDDAGGTALETWTPPDRDGLHALVQRVGRFGEPVGAVIEAMNGARFVHDQLELLGWEVEIADAAKVKGLAPLACKTDRIDAWVLAELSRRDLVPAIWLPTPGIRAERERARWRLHLVKRRTALKNRVHSILIAFGYPRLASDLFGVAGRAQLEALEFPDPWRSNLLAALRLIDELDIDIIGSERDLRVLGAKHPYTSLLMTAPGIGWVLGYTIAAEIGDIARFPSAKKLTGYTGLCPASTSPVRATGGGRSPRTDRGICAGRSSKPPSTPRITRATGRTTNAPSVAAANSVAPRSPASRSPANSPPRSGTCSPAANPSLRQAPITPWSPDDPHPSWAAERPTNQILAIEQAIER